MINNRLPIYFLFAALLIGACKSAEKSAANKPDQTDEAGYDQHRANFGITKDFHEGLTAKTLGNDEDAIYLFKEVLKKDPENAAASYELGRIYFNKNNLEQAAHYASQAVKLNSDNDWYKKLHAEVLAYQGKYDDAADIYEELVKKDPDNFEVLFDLAYMYEKAHNYKESIKMYEKIEEIVGVQEEVSLQKERLFLKLNDLESAIEEIEKLIANYPRESRFYGMLAELYESNNMSDKAMEVYARLADADPSNPYGALALANVYRKKGEKEKYWPQVQEAFSNPDLNIDLKVGYLLEYLPELGVDEEMTQEAKTLGGLLVQTHTEDPKAFALYGDLLYNAGDSEAAILQYEKALELNSGVFTVWQQLMMLLAETGQFEKLREASQEAIELYPNQALTYMFNGVAQQQTGNYEKALKSFDRALLIASGVPSLQAEIYSNMGDTYHTLGQHSKSDEAYDKSLEINPENPYLLNNYSYYLSERGDRLKEAESMAKKANQLMPENASFQDTYGWILFRKGDYKGAKEWLEKSLKNGGEDRAVILEHYGDVLFKLNDVQGAVEYWQKALNKGGDAETLQKKINTKALYD